MEHLKNALAGALGKLELPEGRTAPAPREGKPELPDPLEGEWGARMREEGVEIPREATLGQLVQRSDAKSRALVAQGQKRRGEALRSAKERYLRDRESAAWALVKARFVALELPEKAYRALKQEGGLPEQVLPKLRGDRGEALRGAGAARVREALTTR